MRYLRSLPSHIIPFVEQYIATLEEGYRDINAFLDKHLESDTVSNFVIAGIIATPFIGVAVFVMMLGLSA